MVPEEKVIVLPEKDEMFQRLLQVSNESHMANGLYPILLQNAGQKKYPEGVVLMLSLAIYDYTKDLLPMMSNLVYMYAPQFIDALILDQNAAEEAKAFLNKTLAATRK